LRYLLVLLNYSNLHFILLLNFIFCDVNARRLLISLLLQHLVHLGISFCFIVIDLSLCSISITIFLSFGTTGDSTALVATCSVPVLVYFMLMTLKVVLGEFSFIKLTITALSFSFCCFSTHNEIKLFYKYLSLFNFGFKPTTYKF
jgi:hypothetical protein